MIKIQTLDKSQIYSQVKCPICENNSKKIFEIETINSQSNDIVELLECLNCFHWYHNPMPSEKYLMELYSKDNEFVTGGVLHNEQIASNDTIYRYTLPILKDIEDIKQINYLELGSGAGHLLNFFDKLANYAIGIEPSPPKNAQNTVENIDSLPVNITYDLVVAQDVLEHLSNPIKTLSKLRAKTNKGGFLYIGVPNKDSTKAQLMKSKWSMIRPIGHLHYFSSKSIKFMLQNSGWELMELKAVRMGKLSAIDVIKGFNYSLKNIIYRIIKSLFLGQLILWKDQWYVKAKAK